MLLRWAELLDPHARAASLRALRHCLLELPAPEVQWHGSLLLERLLALLVFREAPPLRELLPALEVAHRLVLPALQPAAQQSAAQTRTGHFRLGTQTLWCKSTLSCKWRIRPLGLIE